MFNKTTNSKKQGDVGLGYAIAHYSRMGYTVCLPMTDSQDYDLIIDDSELKRVQVKTTKCKAPSGNFTANLRVSGGNKSGNTVKNFDNTKVDLIYILTESGIAYSIPSIDLTNVNSITLSKAYDKYII